MLKNSTLYLKPMLLVGLLAGSMILMYGQDTTAPANKPAAKNGHRGGRKEQRDQNRRSAGAH